jgi:addiction module HigA family antidote
VKHPGWCYDNADGQCIDWLTYRLAKDAKLSQQRVNEIVNEKRGITAETDLHLCAYFGLTPGYWLRGQLAYELREALNTVGPKIKASVHPLPAA